VNQEGLLMKNPEAENTVTQYLHGRRKDFSLTKSKYAHTDSLELLKYVQQANLPKHPLTKM
jgi:hypothetical protein